jgi:hypothetical protein
MEPQIQRWSPKRKVELLLSLLLGRERLATFPAHAVLPSARHVPRRVRAFVDFLAARLRTDARSTPARTTARSR